MVKTSLDVPPSSDPDWAYILDLARARREDALGRLSCMGVLLDEVPLKPRCEILEYLVRQEHKLRVDAERRLNEVFLSFTGHNMPGLREHDQW